MEQNIPHKPAENPSSLERLEEQAKIANEIIAENESKIQEIELEIEECQIRINETNQKIKDNEESRANIKAIVEESGININFEESGQLALFVEERTDLLNSLKTEKARLSSLKDQLKEYTKTAKREKSEEEPSKFEKIIANSLIAILATLVVSKVPVPFTNGTVGDYATTPKIVIDIDYKKEYQQLDPKSKQLIKEVIESSYFGDEISAKYNGGWVARHISVLNTLEQSLNKMTPIEKGEFYKKISKTFSECLEINVSINNSDDLKEIMIKNFSNTSIIEGEDGSLKLKVNRLHIDYDNPDKSAEEILLP